LFPPVGPPRRDDADGVAACRERDVQQDAVHRAQHNEPRFTVVLSVILEDNTLIAFERPYDPSEIDAVLQEIAMPLPFIPFEHQTNMHKLYVQSNAHRGGPSLHRNEKAPGREAPAPTKACGR
jgi:hypothetical protein